MVPVVPTATATEVASPRVTAFALVVVSGIVQSPHSPLRSPVSSAGSGDAMNRGLVWGRNGRTQDLWIARPFALLATAIPDKTWRLT